MARRERNRPGGPISLRRPWHRRRRARRAGERRGAEPESDAALHSPAMEQRFAGRVAVVTGTASGLGRATAERLAAEGAVVACLDVSEAANEQTVKAIEANGGRAQAYRADVSDPSVKTAVD